MRRTTLYLSPHSKRTVEKITGDTRTAHKRRPIFTGTRVSKWQYDGIFELAERRSTSASRLIREAVAQYLDRNGIRTPGEKSQREREATKPTAITITVNGATGGKSILRRIIEAVST